MSTFSQYNFANKRALIRVDFNVPLNDSFEVTDDTRIRAAIPTIKKIIADGGSVVLLSHLGRPKSKEEKFSLRHVVSTLSNLLGQDIHFADDCVSSEAIQQAKELKSGEVLLMENVRYYSEEEEGDEHFAERLSELGDVYLNDAFGTAHRKHASTAVVAQFFADNKLFGTIMEAELKGIDRVLNGGEKPITAIIGGAKVSSKIGIIENLLDKVDNILIGGGMTYTFLRARGIETGKSLVEEDKLELAKDIELKAKQKGVKLYLPVDHVTASKFAEDAETQNSDVETIPDGWMGLDAGEKTVELYRDVILNSKTVLWNGPLGVFEMPAFKNGTKKIAEVLAEATEKGVFTLIGGGDSVAAINKFNLAEKVSYVSTGGGAMLESLEGKMLPGVKAILG